jgi:hypothetical protein
MHHTSFSNYVYFLFLINIQKAMHPDFGTADGRSEASLLHTVNFQ